MWWIIVTMVVNGNPAHKEQCDVSIHYDEKKRFFNLYAFRGYSERWELTQINFVLNPAETGKCCLLNS